MTIDFDSLGKYCPSMQKSVNISGESVIGNYIQPELKETIKSPEYWSAQLLQAKTTFQPQVTFMFFAIIKKIGRRKFFKNSNKNRLFCSF